MNTGNIVTRAMSSLLEARYLARTPESVVTHKPTISWALNDAMNTVRWGEGMSRGSAHVRFSAAHDDLIAAQKELKWSGDGHASNEDIVKLRGRISEAIQDMGAGEYKRLSTLGPDVLDRKVVVEGTQSHIQSILRQV